MSSSDTPRAGIRFEDLGEPVQRLLKALKEDVTDADYELLEYVSVKDMAKIYSEMATDRHAEEIWEELRVSLQERKERASRREADLLAKQRELDEERAEEERRQQEQEEEEAREQQAAEEARQRRQEERERQQRQRAEAEEEESAAAERAAQEAAEAAEEAKKEEVRRQKAERKRKRREARVRELQEEQEALEAEKAKQLAKRNRNQKKDWSEYVDSHPLEFKSGEDVDENGVPVIPQEKLNHTLNAPPRISEAVLFRTFTPKCPRCGARFTQPPAEWICPNCQRREHRDIHVWQPDDDTKACMCCKTSIGRWWRHHCRNCGRLVCTNCCGNRAIIVALGFHSPVKVCDQCACNKPAVK